MRRWTIRLLILLGIVAVGLALRATVFAPKPIEVTVTEVSRGRVVSIPFREGEAFKKGDVLLRLDPSVPDARTTLSRRELQTAEQQRQQSCLSAERAARERDRLQKLAAQGIISTDAYDQAQSAAASAAAACRAARAGVEQARASVDLSARQGGQMIIRAPFDGIVADLSAEVGEYTTPSPPGLPIPPVVDVLDPRSIYISATRRQIQMLFLLEASALATTGGALGVLAGLGIAALLRLAVPGLPVHTPLLFVALAVGVSVGTGLLSGLLPARRAARLDPIEALRAE